MDNSAEPPAEQRWATPVGLVVLGGVAAAGALAWCLWAGTDPAGRLLLGVTAVACAAAALSGTVARPRLAADRDGVRIRGLTGATRHDWAQVEGLHVVVTRRFGRAVPTLEMDVGGVGSGPDEPGRLHIFGGLDLGADPRDVADALRRLRRPH